MTSNKRPILVLLAMLLLAVIAGMLVNRDRSSRVLTALEQVSGQADKDAKPETAAETKPEAKTTATAEQPAQAEAEPQAAPVLATPVGPMPWEIVEDDGKVPAWQRKAETILYALLPDLAPPIPHVFPDSSPPPVRSEAELAAERETSAKLAAAALERLVPQAKTAPAKLDAAAPAALEQKAPAQAAMAASTGPAKEPEAVAAPSAPAAGPETAQRPEPAKAAEPAAATPTAAEPLATAVPEAAPLPEKSPAELAAERARSATLAAAALEAILSRGTVAPAKQAAAKAPEKPAPAAPVSPAKAEGPQGPSRETAPAGGGVISEISLESAPGTCTLRIETKSPVERVGHFQKIQPSRLAVDLYGTWIFRGPNTLPGDADFVERVRVGVHPDRFRVVLDYKGDQDTMRGEPVIEKRGNGVLVKIAK